MSVSRRVFLRAGALTAGTAIFPSHVSPASRDRVAELLSRDGRVPPDVYVLTDTLVLRDSDIISDVGLIWSGPADRAVVRVAGSHATLQRTYIHTAGAARAYLRIDPGIDGAQIEDCIFEGGADAALILGGA